MVFPFVFLASFLSRGQLDNTVRAKNKRVKKRAGLRQHSSVIIKSHKSVMIFGYRPLDLMFFKETWRQTSNRWHRHFTIDSEGSLKSKRCGPIMEGSIFLMSCPSLSRFRGGILWVSVVEREGAERQALIVYMRAPGLNWRVHSSLIFTLKIWTCEDCVDRHTPTFSLTFFFFAFALHLHFHAAVLDWRITGVCWLEVVERHDKYRKEKSDRNRPEITI